MKIVLHVDWHRDQYLENMLWPVAMDRRETWTMKKKHENKIKAFEMNQLGQILHIFWMETLYQWMGTWESILVLIKRLFWSHLNEGNILCWAYHEEDRLLFGERNCTRHSWWFSKTGNSTKIWIDNIIYWTRMTMEQRDL